MLRSLSSMDGSRLVILGIADLELAMSWLACSSLASGLSFSPCRVNDTMKLRPSFDLSEMVGLVSSAGKEAQETD